MSKTDVVVGIPELLQSLEQAYALPQYEPRSPLEEFVLSFLLWECPANRAEHALKRLVDSVVDFNELRALRNDDTALLLGKTYPMAEERAERMRLAINDLYNREHAVSFDRVIAMNKRDGRKYVESLDSIPPFVAMRVTLAVLGAHAIPVDGRLLGRLIEFGIEEPGAPLTDASRRLERAIQAREGLRAHHLMQVWTDDPAGDSVKIGASGRRAPGKKKTTASRRAAAKR